jgi:hypothetical protein
VDLFENDALQKSRALAEVKIEDITDEQTLTALLMNAEDIAERAGDRIEELMPKPVTPKYEDPITVTSNFTGESFPAGWLRFEKRNRDFPCENVDGFVGHDYVVPGFMPRMWVDNDLGPPRNGKKNQFICTLCALKVYSEVPPVPPPI